MAVTSIITRRVLYFLVRIWVRLGLMLYCKAIHVSGKEHVSKSAPLILASNHPDSFFDALIIGTVSSRPIHFLTRGDAFNKPWVARILRALKMIPVHRASEGKEHLSDNEMTFAACLDVLRANGAVLFFSEGICKNEWTLRPLKKGTARLAVRAWQDIGDVQIQPVSLTYHSFQEVPKNLWIGFGQPLKKIDFAGSNAAVLYRQINAALSARITENMLSEEEAREAPAESQKSALQYLLALPALAGYFLHRPFYLAIRSIARRKTRDTVFYDSVLFGLLLVCYTLFIILVTFSFLIITKKITVLLIALLLPLSAWCYKKWHE